MWILAGAMFGGAVGVLLKCSSLTTVLAVLVLGLLSWLGRGLSQVLATAVVTLGVFALLFQLVVIASPHQVWPLAWVAPLASVALVAGLVIQRSKIWNAAAPGSAAIAVLEVFSGLLALVMALVWTPLVGSSGNRSAALFLLQHEDNAAWLNVVGNLHDSHSRPAITSGLLSTFGSVLTMFLGFVRTGDVGFGGHPLSSASNAHIVLTSYFLLAAAAPLLAVLLVRRILPGTSFVAALLTWAGLCLVFLTYTLVLAEHGFLSAAIALFLVVFAIALAAGLRPRYGDPGWPLRYLATGVVIFTAGACWIPLVPLAGLVLALLGARPFILAVVDRAWRGALWVVLLSIPAVLMEVALLKQYHGVTDPVGGSDALLTATGSTPTTTTAVEAALFGLLLIGCTIGAGGRRASLLVPCIATSAYAMIVFLVDAWRTSAAPHYGSQKLWFVLAGALLACLFVEVLSSSVIASRGPAAVGGVLVLILAALTVEQGPAYTAIANHWPKPVSRPAWLDTSLRESTGSTPVVCLGTDIPAPAVSAQGLEAYDCSRWSASLQGLDGTFALDWRFTLLGRRSVSDETKELRARGARPIRVIVIGGLDHLHDAGKWWAPLIDQPGLEFVPAAG